MPAPDSIYKKLARHLSSLGMGYPEKDELLDILRENFTPLEAEIALSLPTRVIPFEAVPASTISTCSGIPEKRVGDILASLAHRGLLYAGKTKDGGKGYALQQFGYGFPQTFFWRGTDHPNAKRMAELTVQYTRIKELNEVYGTTKTKAYRYVPASQGLDPASHAVYPFEMMEQVVKNAGTIALVHCACRATAELIGKRKCQYALESCIKYDELADYVIEQGIGKDITKEEALRIIRQSEEAGLVHLVDNAREGVKHTCNCCRCCCWSVGTIRRRKIPRDTLMATYFLRETDLSKCTGCGLCIDVCPVNAVTIENDIPVIDKDWCIGCGVCAVPCPCSAIMLVRRSDALPPKDFKTLQHSILREKNNSRR